jgi:pimeloyl-ACP methyl ester carboxylesterase
MIAWLTRTGMLLVLSAAVALALGSPSHWAWLLGLAVPAALLAAVLAFEMACARKMGVWDQMARPPTGTLLLAWWMEILAMCRLVVWRLPLADLMLLPLTANTTLGKRGLVLVHGYGCNRGVWRAWLAKLRAQQVPCIAIDLEPVFASISTHGPLIESAVTCMQQMTGLAPVVVGHSMGGLAVRSWWAQDRETSRLHRLITLATPHQGTVLAQFGHGAAARQMRRHSQWLACLQAQETPAHTQRTLCFYSACDNVVIPARAAILPGADNREVFGCAHVAMVDHADCFAAALRCVRESA